MSVQFPTNASVCNNGKILWELLFTCTRLHGYLVMQICRRKIRIATSEHRQQSQKTPCGMKLQEV